MSSKYVLTTIVLINAVFLVTGYWTADLLGIQFIAYVLMFSLAGNWVAVAGLGSLILWRLLFQRIDSVSYLGALELFLIIAGLIGWRVVGYVTSGLLA